MRYFVIFSIFVFMFTSCKKETLPLKPINEQPKLSWDSLNIPIAENESKQIMAIALNSKDDLFVGTGDGRILRLLAGDSTWVQVTRLGWNVISFIFIDTHDHIFIGTKHFGNYWYGKIEYSEDNGTSWKGIFNKLRDTHCFATYQDYYYSAGYFAVSISEDFGLNWTRIDSGIAGKVVQGMAIDQSNGDIYISIWDEGILRSTDNGNSWVANSFQGWDVDPLFSTENGYIFVGTGGGIYRSTDHGKTWHYLDNGIENVFVQCFASSSKNYILVGTQNNGLYLSKDFGDSWTNIGLHETSILSVAFDKNDFAYVGTDSLGILKSTIPLDY